MFNWVGLHFSGLVVGTGLMRDVNLPNSNDEIMILDLAPASVGSVLVIDAYIYLHPFEGQPLNNIQKMCAHLRQDGNDNRKLRMVTSSRECEDMSASRHDLYNVTIKDCEALEAACD
jgi:hypothetical protein